jgi:transposase
LPWKLKTDFISLRNAIIKADSEIEGTEEHWQSEVPYDTRQLAVKDAVAAFKAACTNKQRGHIRNFKLSFKSRKMPSQICWLDANAVKKTIKKPRKKKRAAVKGRRKKGKKRTQPTSSTLRLTLFPTRLGEDRYIRVRKRQLNRLPTTFESDSKIQKYGKDYYLVYSFSQSREEKKENDTILSLDPGVRTFQTGYSPSGVLTKFGEEQGRNLDQLQARLDSLRSQKSKSKGHHKYRVRLRCLRTELKIKHMVQNLHNQVASHISKTYGTILLPKFSTSVMQIGSSLSSSTKRDLWSLGHYTFQQKLLNLCNKRGSVLYIVEEHYTTKTCGGCGILQEVGAAKVYCCPHCKYRTDRDVHGARNILLKHLTQHGAN